jgi:hypothetical protein
MIILAAAIILSLNNAGIINKANQAVQETDLAQVKHLATFVAFIFISISMPFTKTGQ